MPPGSRKRKDRRRREAEAEEDQVNRSIGRGHHLHIHEIHGYEQVRHLRRPYRVALGYVPRES